MVECCVNYLNLPINHSVKPGQIKNSIARFDELDAIYQSVHGLLSSIKISSEAISYYGKLTIKYQLAQINNLVDDNQRHLYLLAFVVHQYKCWQDVFLQIIKKSVRATDNKASKSIDATYAHNAPTKNELTDSVADGYYDYRNLVTQIEKKAFDHNLNNDQFRCDVQDILNNRNSDHLNQSDQDLQTLQNIMDKEKSHQGYFDQHDQLSRKLQNKVAEIIKRLHFTFEPAADDLKSAIEYYQSGASITKTLAPDAFLSDEQHAQIYQDGQFNISLYKSMLYVNLFDAFSCGAASLAISYKYLPISAYMMDENSWKKNKKLILKRLGLEEFENIDEVLVKLQSILDQKYYDVNADIHSGDNPFIRFNAKKNDSLIIRTPAVDKPNYESVAHMIGENRNIPILEMLTSLNKFLRFTTPLTHFKVKSKVKIPDDKLFIAGIFALGSDIGIQRLSKSSIGINANKLTNAVKWYFAVENLHAVNNLLTDFMNKMSLPEQFKKEKDFLHTSSDGRKRSVSIESLVSNYSYKYFGHGKGINIYTFVDERGILFHSTVFSSSDRDAPYVIDGLLHNEGVKSDMHSTDTHGYTEAIFAISHLLGITFAPRIAKLSKQRLSSFGSIKEGLVEKGYKVLPSNKIGVKLIKDHWDVILRLIASIKSRDFRASTILKRLSSYDKKHALQEAIQEFGKIIKSIFILNYIDSVELRQSIEKQLNKGELSNKFSKAVSFAPNQEINEAEREDQEKTAICKMIIQNAIILWNYIELTMMILNEKDEDKRKEMLANIKESSILTWRHVNMHGIYDFSKLIASNEPKMTAQEILDADVA